MHVLTISSMTDEESSYENIDEIRCSIKKIMRGKLGTGSCLYIKWENRIWLLGTGIWERKFKLEWKLSNTSILGISLFFWFGLGFLIISVLGIGISTHFRSLINCNLQPILKNIFDATFSKGYLDS